MPILNNILRKNAICPTCAQPQPLDPSRKQHVPNGFQGLTYGSPLTEDPITNAPQHNTATLANMIHLQVQQPGVVVPSNTRIKLHPGNTHILAHVKVNPIVHRAGGPSPTSNTPFHPQPMARRPRPVMAGAYTTEKAQTAIAVATSKAVNQKPFIGGTAIKPIGSFLEVSSGGSGTLSSYSNMDSNVSRWSVMKQGAAG